MISIINSCQFFGATVRGPYHSMVNAPNQDAWCGQKNRNTIFVSVCDGMGSRPNANVGAKAACSAVREAITVWSKYPNTSVEYLLKLIKIIWEMKIAPLSPSDCATTCLFACITENGKLSVVGLGDGLVLVRKSDGQLIKVIDRTIDFSNRTKGLGQPHKLDDWKTFSYDNFEPGMSVLLATDGIADDLDQGTLPGLIPWIIDEFGSLSSPKRTNLLHHTLRNWPTQLHQDDKTLAILYCPFQKEIDEP